MERHRERARGRARQTEQRWPGEERGGEAAAPKELSGRDRRIKEEDTITMSVSQAKGLTIEMLMQLAKKKYSSTAPAQKSTKTKERRLPTKMSSSDNDFRSIGSTAAVSLKSQISNKSTICNICKRNILSTEYDSYICDILVSEQNCPHCDDSLSHYALKEHRSRNYPALKDLGTTVNCDCSTDEELTLRKLVSKSRTRHKGRLSNRDSPLESNHCRPNQRQSGSNESHHSEKNKYDMTLENKREANKKDVIAEKLPERTKRGTLKEKSYNKEEIQEYVNIQRRMKKLEDKRKELVEDLEKKRKELNLLTLNIKSQEILKRNLQKKK